jgi:3-isopropylmalate dehydrogenase
MKLAWLKGDGIGPEIMSACRQVLDAANDQFELGLTFDDIRIGKETLATDGSTFPTQALERARQCDGIVLGPVSHFDYPAPEEGGINPSGELRVQLDLYANLRPAFTRKNIRSFGDHQFDLLIVRENTEGFYADRNMHVGPGEYMPTPDLALATRKITRDSCMRIARVAFEQAVKRRSQVTAVHKANVMRVSDGLFLECTRAVAKQFPGISYNERIVDAMAALLIRDPSAFDVIVTTNMFGDILSDQATEMAGGLGLAASLNAGEHHAMAQAQHGSAPDIAGKGIANPVSVIASAAMLLNWYGQRQPGDGNKYVLAANAVNVALEAALIDTTACTPDLGGEASTDEFTSRITQLLIAS